MPSVKANRPKNAQERKDRLNQILEWFDKAYPNAECALTHSSPWELLVATILSAQCTDKRVNMVTPGLFVKYPTIHDFAAVRPEVLAQDVKQTGFFNNKAKSIVGAANKILSDLVAKCREPSKKCFLFQEPLAKRRTLSWGLPTVWLLGLSSIRTCPGFRSVWI
jgi:endonuclease-3